MDDFAQTRVEIVQNTDFPSDFKPKHDPMSLTEKIPLIDRDFPEFCEYMKHRIGIDDLYTLMPFFRFMREKYPNLHYKDWLYEDFLDNLVGQDVMYYPPEVIKSNANERLCDMSDVSWQKNNSRTKLS